MPEAGRWRVVVLATATAWLGFGLFIAALANGSFGYLARVGILERSAYADFVSAYCDGASAASTVRPMACWCMSPPSATAPAGTPDRDYLFNANGARLLPKLAKEAWLAGFLVLSFGMLTLRRSQLPRFENSRPVLVLTTLVLFGFLLAVVSHGALEASVGLRPFEFLAIAGLGAWTSSSLQRTGRWLVWLLLAEVVLVGIELRFGLPLRSCPNSFRAAGTMVLSNTLGIVAVAAFAFVAAFGSERKWLVGLVLAVGLLLAASGSGTGLVMLFCLLVLAAFRIVPAGRARIAGGAAVLLAGLLAAALPTLTKRPDIYDSVFAPDGRVDKAVQVLEHNSITQNLLGRGLGPGSNLSSNLGRVTVSGVEVGTAQARPFYADSTVTFLLVQLGIAGVLAFYAMLAWAWRRDERARAFYLVVAVASLTINIPEVFPVNFLLGLALAHTLALTESRQPAQAAA